VRLKGCLGRVPRAERRVLKLRAGVGIARTRSRAQVARITGISRARVARLERRGLRHLRALGRAGACAVTPTAGSSAAAGLPVAGAPQGGGPQSGAATGQVLAERHSGTSHPAKPESESSMKQSIELPLGRPGSASTGGSSSFDFTIVLVALALALLGFVLVREVRRTT
jgi:hypothetical protein